jgi:steroid delta-isomerase-like uncharacterized protein
MSEAARVARAYFEAVDKRDLDAMTACWIDGAPDILHGVVELEAPHGIRDWFGNTFAAVPDSRLEILDLVDGDGQVAVRWRLTGTFSGNARFEGLIATGAAIDITGCDVITVEDGKIRRNDAYLNGNQLAQQLGALPPSGSPQERAMIGALNLKTRALSRLRR